MDTTALSDRIKELLLEADVKFHLDAEGDFWVPFEGAVVFVCPSAMGNLAVAKIWSYVAVELTDDTGLAEFLNETNCKMLFGKFCYYATDQMVRFESPLIAQNLDSAELLATLAIVAQMTHQHAEKIVERWGGKIHELTD